MPFFSSWETLSGRISSRQHLQFSVPFAANSIWCLFHHRVAVLDKVTDFLLFLGKLLIVGIVGMWAFIFRPLLSGETIGDSHLNPDWLLLQTGIFSFFFFSGRIKAVEDAAPSLNYYWVPILVSRFILACNWPAAHKWKLSDSYFSNLFSLTFKKCVCKQMLLDVWTKSQWLYKQNIWVISNIFLHNGSDVLL